MSAIVYIRMKKYIEFTNLQQVHLKHIAYITTDFREKNKLQEIPIYRITKKDKEMVVIDAFLIINHLNEIYPHLEIQVIGPTQTIIKIQNQKRRASIIAIAFIWILLFIGTAMTIMNFHYDVSMQEVQQKLHYLLTGQHNEFPLWIQIPYSLGLGVGMLLFFNHWFKKRFNEEPSPLEVEIFNYQQDLDNYIMHHENKLNDTKPPY